MKPSDKDLHNIENAMAAAYHGKGDADLSEVAGDMWQIKVMSHIRQIGPLNSESSYLELFDRFVWRFAPVACILIIVLAACLYNIDASTEYKIATAYVDDPVGYAFVQAFGI